MATSYWYDVASGQVVKADSRESEVWLGPFTTSAEAEDAPVTFIAYANEWLGSDEGQRYLDMAKAEHGDVDLR